MSFFAFHVIIKLQVRVWKLTKMHDYFNIPPCIICTPLSFVLGAIPVESLDRELSENTYFYGRMSWTGPSNLVELFHGSPIFNVFRNFLSTSTRPSPLTLVSICSLISILWNKKYPRSLGCIIRKLQYKIYRYVPRGMHQVEPVGEEPIELHTK